MPTYRVGLTQFQRVLLELVPELEKATVRGLKSAAQRLAGMVVEEIDQAKPFPAVDRGSLRQSVDVDQHDDGATVEVRAPHAAILELGTRPFWPPLAPILEWVKRKGVGVMAGPVQRGGGAAWRAAQADGQLATARAIQAAIAQRGIAPRRYFAKAVARLPPVLEQELKRELANMKVV